MTRANPIPKPTHVAFTDANVSADGHVTGAIMVCTLQPQAIESILLINYGRSGVTNTKAELDTKIATLHRFPAHSLLTIFSDSKSTVDMLQTYKRRPSQPLKGLNRALPAQEMNILNAGLKRQHHVSFVHLPREDKKIALMDVFSRYARRQPVGLTEVYIAPFDRSLESHVKFMHQKVSAANQAKINLE